MGFLFCSGPGRIEVLEGKVLALENRVISLVNRLEESTNIWAGERPHFIYAGRPKVSISTALLMLLKHQGLKVVHTSCSEKSELVKISTPSAPLICTENKRKRKGKKS